MRAPRSSASRPAVRSPCCLCTTAASPSYGPWRPRTRRVSYPLNLTRAAASVALRTALIGNAAQALHPVAGQGFNLGLRDAAMLAELIANASGDVGVPALLRT